MADSTSVPTVLSLLRQFPDFGIKVVWFEVCIEAAVRISNLIFIGKEEVISFEQIKKI
jgi:hypothetical protein